MSHGATRTMAPSSSEPPGPSRAFLVVYARGGVEVVDLETDRDLVVGRDAVADVRLDDDRVSRRHASFRFDGSAIVVRDLESRNGTLVNGRRLSKPARIVTGDEVGVGRARLVAGLTAVATHAGHRLAPWGEIEAHLAVAIRSARRGDGVCALALLSASEESDATAILEALPDGARAGRYGGTRIGMLFRAASPPSAREVVERILRRTGPLSKAGLALAPDDGADVERIVEAARLALSGAAAGRVGAAPREAEGRPGGLVALDPAMRAALDLAHRVAPHETSVLLLGETGVGKEVLAREIHRRSRRAAAPFVAVNCGAIPGTLVEATLFGHERGAFTGATDRREGTFQAAAGGTLLLDEVGELSAGAQAAMLRVLERGEVTRVGSTRPESVSVRVIAATNVDLEEAVLRGTFRRDLLYRLDRFAITVPPLRDRPDDLETLVAQALGDRELSAGARKSLAAYPWPGNVRELLNVLERAVVLAGDGPVDESHLPLRLAGTAQGGGNLRNRVAGTETEAIRAALDATGGNRTHAAKRLGISRRALLYKMQRLGLR